MLTRMLLSVWIKTNNMDNSIKIHLFDNIYQHEINGNDCFWGGNDWVFGAEVSGEEMIGHS